MAVPYLVCYPIKYPIKVVVPYCAYNAHYEYHHVASVNMCGRPRMYVLIQLWLARGLLETRYWWTFSASKFSISSIQRTV